MVDNKFVDILLVEHNPGDVRIITDALKAIDASLQIEVIWNGLEALGFLRREAPFGDSPQPRIMIMDLNLPLKHGRELLKEIKSDPVLAPLPTIVLSGSDAPQDISACYALGANCYIVKPRHLDDYKETIRSLVDFWLRKVRLPAGDRQRADKEAEGEN